MIRELVARPGKPIIVRQLIRPLQVLSPHFE
jgi:hypothetical protein